MFAYRIRTVDAAGQESGPSPAFFTIPSSPQGVFSREDEDGTSCRLKWLPNPETGSGCHVLRDGLEISPAWWSLNSCDPVVGRLGTDTLTGLSTIASLPGALRV